MRPFRMGHQLLCQFHDDGHTGFIVCAQQSSSRGSNNVVADALLQIRLLLFVNNHRRGVGQHDGASVPAGMQNWLYPCSTAVGRGINMRTKTNAGSGLPFRQVRWNARIHIAVFVQFNLRNSIRPKLVNQHAAQIQLLGR